MNELTLRNTSGIETAEKRGVKSCGHNANQADLAPKGFITGAELKWGTIYKSFAGMIAKGGTAEHGDRRLRQGDGHEFAVRRRLQRSRPQCRDRGDCRPQGGQADLVGEVKSNTGKVITSKDTGLYDPALETTDYLVEGIVGTV